MQTCPSCKNELSERGFHRPACGAHVRRKACREILDLDARFCVTCGAAVGEPIPSHMGNNTYNITGPAYNVIEFEENTRGRRFLAKVTDQAIDSVSNLLTLFLIELYEARGKSAEIQDNDRNYLMLKDLVDGITSGTTWNLGRETKQALPLFKSLGDRSAHNRRYLAKKADIDKELHGLRVAADDLLHLSGLK